MGLNDDSVIPCPHKNHGGSNIIKINTNITAVGVISSYYFLLYEHPICPSFIDNTHRSLINLRWV